MRKLPERFLSKKRKMRRPSSVFIPERLKLQVFVFTDRLYVMQYNVFFYRLMTHRLEDSKREKEISKFQKQPFTYVL